jgi:cyclohexa-1,5-dienecarbonyl-CoA hydratase
MSYELIRTDLSDGVATIVLNREPLNILNIAMMEEINSALKDFQHKQVKVLVFRAEGKSFSGGVDVGEHMGDMAPKMIEAFHAMFRNMDQLLWAEDVNWQCIATWLSPLKRPRSVNLRYKSVYFHP